MTAEPTPGSKAASQPWELGGPPRVEDRLLGLNKHLILPTLAILAVAIFWSSVVPAIDEAITADEFEAGTVLELARGVEFSPAKGWLPDGVPVPNNPGFTVFRDGVTFTVSAGGFEGTPQELLDEVIAGYSDYDVTGDVYTLTLSSGIPGVAQEIFGVDFSGAVFAFVDDTPEGEGIDSRDTGIKVVVEGPPEIIEDYTEDIGNMIASIRVVYGGEE